MRKRPNRVVFLLLSAFVTALLLGQPLSLRAAAITPYEGYSYDRWGDAVPARAGYLPERAVSGATLGVGHFANPSDLFCDKKNRFFVADTDNNRIVVVNEDWTAAIAVLQSLYLPDGAETTLNAPKGVFVSPETELIYIADSDNARVLLCDLSGQITQVIEKPQAALYPQENTFLPQKVLADKAGNVYVVLNNTTSGACVFDNTGAFTGFYGANRVEPTAEVVARHFWHLIATDEMLEKSKKSVAAAFSSFDMDADGFIYTATESATQTTDRVKKVSFAGKNLFASLKASWGDDTTTWYSGTSFSTRIVDIDIGDDETIHCLDATTGRVFQYDKDCNLLFILGTKAEQVGGFSRPTALETCGSSIFVLDGDKNTVTIFAETKFGSIVHRATALYNAGRYEEALVPWNEVLRQDGNYRRAYIGISGALFYQGDYQGAMRYAKLGDDAVRYDRAFASWRASFLKQNLAWLLGGTLFLTAGCVCAVCIRKKRRTAVSPAARAAHRRLMQLTQRQWLFHVVLHPFSGYEDLRWKKAGSLKIAVALVVLLLFAMLAQGRLLGFQFGALPEKLFSIAPYFVKSILVFAFWVIGNWAVSTWLDGEGTLKNICVYSAYALVPYLVRCVVCVLLTHVLVREEAVFLTAASVLGILWSAVLLFLAIQTVHQYSPAKTVVSILLTLASMLVMLLLLVLLLSLFQQIYVFVYSIYTEVAYRIMV